VATIIVNKLDFFPSPDNCRPGGILGNGGL
jgi:hypothetical protein